jgi:hypothetical protein
MSTAHDEFAAAKQPDSHDTTHDVAGMPIFASLGPFKTGPDGERLEARGFSTLPNPEKPWNMIVIIL